MAIKQLSVFVENTHGSLAGVCKTLAEHNVDLRALSLADTQDFGILRLIVSDTELASKVLRDNNNVISVNKVIGVKTPDKPGGLSEMLTMLEEGGVNIEYMYAFITPSSEHACVVIRVADNERAERILAENGIELITEDEIKSW